MKKILAMVLFGAGGMLLYLGNQRRESLPGAAQSVGHEIASAFDGKPRVTDQTLYFVGGGALIVVGLFVVVRRSG